MDETGKTNHVGERAMACVYSPTTSYELSCCCVPLQVRQQPTNGKNCALASKQSKKQRVRVCLYDGPPSPRQCPRGRDELRSRPFAEPALSLTPGRLLSPHTRQRRGRAAASRLAHTRRLLSTSRTGSAIAPSVGGSVPL